MNNIRLEIRNIIKEVFDIDKDLSYSCEDFANSRVCKFKSNDIDYSIIFRRFENIPSLYINDVEIKKYAESLKDKYFFDFGILKNNKLNTDITTNLKDHYNVINTVFKIIKDFIENKNIKVIAYFAEEKRKKIYDYIFKKHFKDGFFRYSKKEAYNIPVYYIKYKEDGSF